jgi:hypothetical protein
MASVRGCIAGVMNSKDEHESLWDEQELLSCESAGRAGEPVGRAGDTVCWQE